MGSNSYNTQREIDLIELELSLEKDLDILFETGFNQYGRALCWKKHPGFPYRTQCVINLQGTILVQANSYLNKYDRAEYYYKEKQLTLVKLSELKEDLSYKLEGSAICEDIDPFNQGIARIKIVVPFPDHVPSPKSDVVYGTSEYNYINFNGDIIFSENFADAANYSDGLFPVRSFKDRECYYLRIDKTSLLHRPQPVVISSMYGLFIDSNYHLINSFDKQLTNKCTTITYTDNHQIALVEYGPYTYDKKCCFIFPNGQKVPYLDIKAEYEKSHKDGIRRDSAFSNGIISIVIEGYGIKHINLEGQLLSKVHFSISDLLSYHSSVDLHKFSQGFAVVKTPKGFNYINQRGELLLKEFKNFAGPFSSGLALVKNEQGDYYFIDRRGKKRFNISIPDVYRSIVLLGRVQVTPIENDQIKFEQVSIFDLDGNFMCETTSSLSNLDDQFSMFLKEDYLDWWGNKVQYHRGVRQ
ncbi:MAG: WG repeat-containing protein [Candidatus Cloacimonetes bacterium]|nr:WG repeat-containing protein [Candidatus Cloacimonadota bacterium]